MSEKLPSNVVNLEEHRREGGAESSLEKREGAFEAEVVELRANVEDLQHESSAFQANVDIAERAVEKGGPNADALRSMAKNVQEKYDELGRKAFVYSGLATLFTMVGIAGTTTAFIRGKADAGFETIPSSMPSTWGEQITLQEGLVEGLDMTTRAGAAMFALTILSRVAAPVVGKIKSSKLFKQAEELDTAESAGQAYGS